MFGVPPSGGSGPCERGTQNSVTRAFDFLLLLLTLLAIALLFSGCLVQRKNQVLIKTTVFGMQIGASPGGGMIPNVQLGLVRNEYVSNPTSSNALYAAPFTATSSGDLSPLKQTASETITSLTATNK